MIYLASPYSDPDENVRSDRYQIVFEFVAKKLKSGAPIFSPIVYGHQFAMLLDFAYDAMTWQSFNHNMLLAADILWVYEMEGWQDSKGVKQEMEWAKRNDKAIRRILHVV